MQASFTTNRETTCSLPPAFGELNYGGMTKSPPEQGFFFVFFGAGAARLQGFVQDGVKAWEVAGENGDEKPQN